MPASIPLEKYRDVLIARFWETVVKTEACWNWAGTTGLGGYGRLRIRKPKSGYISAHRFSWELHNGPIPDGMMVCHSCDNPPCTNPAHLFLGSCLDNMRDAKEKGRAYTEKIMAPAREATTRRNKTITHCPKGHPYDEQNTRYQILRQKGREYRVRNCMTCRRDTDSRRNTTPQTVAQNEHITVLASKSLVNAFRYRAKSKFPIEHLEALFGKIEGGKIFIHMFYPMEHKGSRYACTYDPDELTFLEEESARLGLIHLGSVHSHCGRHQCEHGSEHDHKQGLEEGEILMGVINVYKKDGKTHTNLKFYLPQPPIAIKYAA